MKENKIYTVIFVIIISCICAFSLTYVNIKWQKLINENENFAKMSSILRTLNLTTKNAEQNEVIDIYNQYIIQKNRGSLIVYEGQKDDNIIGYAMDIIGRGKGGPIKGIMAIGKEEKTILALDIYHHNETPGLGDRIATKEWLDQFINLPLLVNGVPGIIISSTAKGPNVVQAITGATKTTFSIQKIINQTIAQFFSGGMDLVELDLGLTAEAITRATPGYPRYLKKPAHLRKEVRRTAFMIRPGVINLALSKPVTCSMKDEPIIGDLEQLTDDVKTSGEFDFVELDLGLQWVQIDLEAVYNISAVVVWHYYKNPTIYNDVIVQIADDGKFTQNVHTLFNNDHDNSAGLGKGKDTAYYARWWAEIADARGTDYAGTSARYVRVYTAGGCGAEDTRFIEIAVYGK